MIRKTIIVMLTLAALGTGLTYSFSTASVHRLFSIGTITVSIQDETLFASYGDAYLDNCVRHTGPRIYQEDTGVWVLEMYIGIPFVLFVTYPTIAFIRGPWRRYRRRKKGLCVKCGYDLAGNESGVCSECGHER